ncbi:PEGA domain-containing protein, partial [bacterium]|nr:PEGA domain-containing protein [bacterium]
DVAETTNPTISELKAESQEEDPPSPDPTMVSYNTEEENAAVPESSGSTMDDGLTKSHISAVESPEEEPKAPAPDEPSLADPSLTQESISNFSSKPSGNRAGEIHLKDGGAPLDLVLPGGAKHLSRESVSISTKSATVAKTAAPSPAPQIPADPNTNSGEVSTLGRSQTGSQTHMRAAPKTEAAPPPTPQRAQTGSFNLQMTTPIEDMESSVNPGVRPRPQGNWRHERPPEPKKRSMLPRLIGFLSVLALTGYTYHLFLNGSITQWIENNAPREPTDTPEAAIATDEGLERVASACALNVRSQPAVAEVFLNNVSQGVTPRILSVPCGKSVNVVLRKEGYDSVSENVETRSKSMDWNRTLTPQVRGSLAVTLGFIADVYSDGEKVGEAQVGKLVEFPLRAKQTHQIRLVNGALGIDYSTEATIEEGQRTWLKLTLEEVTARTRQRKKR